MRLGVRAALVALVVLVALVGWFFTLPELPETRPGHAAQCAVRRGSGSLGSFGSLLFNWPLRLQLVAVLELYNIHF